MSQKSPITIALVGNPNSGKTSLFNRLTGLNQKVGNFPGVTVDKKTGLCKLKSGESRIIDLPGSYSIYPKSVEERIVLNLLNNPKDPEYPDIIVVIADATNLKRNLLLFTQVHDLGIPTILALNMADLIRKKKKKIEKELLQSRLGVDVVMINARDGEGIEELKEAIENISCSTKPYMEVEKPTKEIISGVPVKIQKKNDYAFVQLLHHFDTDSSLSEQEKGEIRKLIESAGFDTRMEQRQETLKRYEFLDEVLEGVVHSEDYSIEKERASKSTRFDTLFTHKIWGYGVFLLLLFLIFQAIFKWSELPMDLIDGFFSGISNTLITNLPEGKLTSLLADGVIPGIAGILIFIPQIALLFTFIALLEESGYMARVVFIMDRLMRKVGLNGRSIVPLISGVACAVPAIMATRTIDSYKDRIITIMVTPLMSCSARLPVYTILIALVIPSTTFAGIINIQGLVLFALYFAGFFAAIVASYIFKKIIKTKEPSYLVMEMPNYRWPRWKNVLITIVEKVKTFISEAGKIILAISIVLWVLSSYGPGEKFDNAEEIVKTEYADQLLDEKEL
ncbi:MAG: ferrous iron transport protein B, partial [Cyclobacteriaceae bacterium]|nr:ferrous iron transport protein B [Cyclobacteriaceae bacterium]